MWDAYHKGLWDFMSKRQVLEKLFPNYGRLHTTAMKFAMQLSAIDWSMDGGSGPICISQAQFAKAQLLAEDYRASLHCMIEDASRPTEDKDFEKKILRYLESTSKGLTSREISRATHMSSAPQRQELDLILVRMMEDGLIIHATRKKKRDPDADVWMKNSSRWVTVSEDLTYAPKIPPFTLEEHPGDRYPDLETAQRLALPSMARDLAVTIRALLEEGILIIEQGQIKPNPKLEDKNV